MVRNWRYGIIRRHPLAEKPFSFHPKIQFFLPVPLTFRLFEERIQVNRKSLASRFPTVTTKITTTTTIPTLLAIFALLRALRAAAGLTIDGHFVHRHVCK
jgi:hypothetical protein